MSDTHTLWSEGREEGVIKGGEERERKDRVTKGGERGERGEKGDHVMKGEREKEKEQQH